MAKQITIKANRIQVGDTFIKSVEVGLDTGETFEVTSIAPCNYSEYMITLNGQRTVHMNELVVVKR